MNVHQSAFGILPDGDVERIQLTAGHRARRIGRNRSPLLRCSPLRIGGSRNRLKILDNYRAWTDSTGGVPSICNLYSTSATGMSMIPIDVDWLLRPCPNLSRPAIPACAAALAGRKGISSSRRTLPYSPKLLSQESPTCLARIANDKRARVLQRLGGCSHPGADRWRAFPLDSLFPQTVPSHRINRSSDAGR